jgi:Na+/H+ antiporter NhaC
MANIIEAHGWMTLIPLIVMLILVASTKKVFESILISTALVYIFSDGYKFIFSAVNGIYDVFAEGTYAWIVLMLALFGGLIALMIQSGGINGFKKFATRYVKSERSSLVLTWILGLILFIDDYVNNLGIGPTMRGITDKYKVPREQLGFTICSMGTPICAMVPVTAFAVFVFTVMQDNGVSGENANMVTEYIKVIPYMFFPICIVIISLLLSLGVLPRVGHLKKYYKQIEEGTYELTEKEKEEVRSSAEEDIVSDDAGSNLLDFALPVVLLVVVMLITSDLVFSVICALALAFVMYIPRKKMTVTEFFSTFFSGINDMIFILVVVLMTFVFVEGLNGIGFSDYVVGAVTPLLSGGAIPALTFITVAVVAFLGVDYWAVMLLIAPIALPLATQFDVSSYITMAAIVSGSVFGGTSCFFAEQMLMCSQAVERPTVRLALTGLPYSLLGGVVTVGLYLIFGFAI